MVMPFIEGRSLQSIVENNGPISYNEAANYITHIAHAADYLHKRHILHRDIKPDNILLTAEQKAMLIDFGSACMFEEDKIQSHTTILTMGYAPVEQYTSPSKIGAHTDIYAIGATLYFILTGEVPLYAHERITERMLEPKELNPNIPEWINRTIIKAMQLDYVDRYRTINDFLNDLLNKNASIPIQQTSKTPIDSKRIQQIASAQSENKSQKKTTKVLIALLLLGVVCALVYIFDSIHFHDGVVLGLIGALMFIAALWQKNKYLKKQPFEVSVPDGKTPSSLYTFCGIGHNLLGALKYRKKDGTFVAYTFVFVLLPLFPTGCYRVEEGDGDNFGLYSTKEWKIYGSEKKNTGEILNIYLLYYGLFITLFGFIIIFL
jgi:serine/threonine protein kinase